MKQLRELREVVRQHLPREELRLQATQYVTVEDVQVMFLVMSDQVDKFGDLWEIVLAYVNLVLAHGLE